MILTKKFVFIHLPKTGGTFVTHVLADIHSVDLRSKQTIALPLAGRVVNKVTRSIVGKNVVEKSFVNLNKGDRIKHGGWSRIPERYRDKIIVSTIRNPYDKYVSDYEFRYWAIHPEVASDNPEKIKEEYPHFPELTFEEFLHVSGKYFKRLPKNNNFSSEEDLGWYSEIFVRLFFKCPYSVYPKIDNEYIEARKYEEDMIPVHFLRTERLNRDLYDFLISVGYPQKKVEIILNKDKILPAGKGRSADQKWEKYYTPQLKQLVRTKDRLIFELFPEYDV